MVRLVHLNRAKKYHEQYPDLGRRAEGRFVLRGELGDAGNSKAKCLCQDAWNENHQEKFTDEFRDIELNGLSKQDKQPKGSNEEAC